MNTYQKDLIQQLKESIEQMIDELLPKKNIQPEELHSAIRYGICNGGKRVRGILVLLCADIFSERKKALPAAVAIESIHAYSLIHDDLPAIDDSSLRRNKPSCHTAFDEATAILAGDSLLTEAFKILAEHYQEDPFLATRLIQILSSSSSSMGMIGGQMEDIRNEGESVSEETLEFIHKNKTAKLIAAAVKMGFSFANKDMQDDQAISNFGYNLGMAFQYTDDLLDVQSDSATLGKPTGSDKASDKLSSIKVYGVNGAQNKARRFTEQAKENLKSIEVDTNNLIAYVDFLANRIS